jgi:hypothetical protein
MNFDVLTYCQYLQISISLEYWIRGHHGRDCDHMVVGFYNYLCHQRLSPLKLWVRILFMVRSMRYNILCNKVCQWLATGDWFSAVSCTNKTDRHEIAEILLNNPEYWIFYHFKRWKYKSNVSYRKKDNSNKL